jgi:hypothetical protein
LLKINLHSFSESIASRILNASRIMKNNNVPTLIGMENTPIAKQNKYVCQKIMRMTTKTILPISYTKYTNKNEEPEIFNRQSSIE